MLGREEKNRVMKHMVMQAIEHGKVPCDWSNKQWRVHIKFSLHEIAHENHWT